MREIAIGTSVIRIQRGDLTMLGRRVGAIVNAANEQLRPTPGINGSIFEFAGPELASECLWIGDVETGHAVMTSAGHLIADRVIHAVGPVWCGGGQDEDRLLASAYRTSLELAAEQGLRTIAFPALSTGSYGFPVDRAVAIAIGTVAAYLKRSTAIDEVILVAYSDYEYQCFDIAADRWERTQATRAARARTAR